jgi:hypothetical protein
VENNAAAIKSENRRLSWKVLLSASLSIVVLIGAVQFTLNALEGEEIVTPMVTPSPSAVAMQPATESATAEVEPSPVTSGVSLVISAARGDARIHVVASGNTLYRGPLLQGEEKSFNDRVSIAIYLSNAGDIDLTLNGEKLAPRGARNQEIRETFRAK